ncbi:SEC-C domain-containing protein [Flavobacterium sp.]|uniref:SEC-C domain-containing protein n=1 Tax=Flavobacterium sp. TaxID=239 RepID=UPI0025EFA279|nr:SEC-C domain-containing protein [Flavobacterium sp.]
MRLKIEKDIEKFIEKYPKFSIIENDNLNYIKLQGILDIVDLNGIYWDSYEVSILLLKKGYPNIIPLVHEVSEKIKREDDWHISEKGECCLDITHKLILLQNKGIDLIPFYQNKIYPFFTNHTYKLNTGNYANGDYPHQFEGIKDFYKNDLGLTDANFIIQLLTYITTNKLPKRNDICICNQKKYKHCHLPIVEKIIAFGRERLLEDLKNFKL